MNKHGEDQKCDCYSCSSEIMLQDIEPGKGLVELRRLPSGRFEVGCYVQKTGQELSYTTSKYMVALVKYATYQSKVRGW